MIAEYEGTVLLVSHDRDFLDRTVTVTLGLDGSGRVDIVAGGYDAWEKRRANSPLPRARGAGGIPVKSNSPSNEPSPQPSPASGRGSKLTYNDQRDLDRLPAEIERIEAQIAAAEDSLHDPALYSRDPERFAALTAKLEKLRADKLAAEERWFEVAAMAEALAR